MSHDLLKYPRIFGLCNNFGYVVMLTAAYDLNKEVCIAFFYTTICNNCTWLYSCMSKTCWLNVYHMFSMHWENDDFNVYIVCIQIISTQQLNCYKDYNGC